MDVNRQASVEREMHKEEARAVVIAYGVDARDASEVVEKLEALLNNSVKMVP